MPKVSYPRAENGPRGPKILYPSAEKAEAGLGEPRGTKSLVPWCQKIWGGIGGPPPLALGLFTPKRFPTANPKVPYPGAETVSYTHLTLPTTR